MSKRQIILGIETSCDETAAAIYDEDNGLLAHEIYSQVQLHNQFGGVVPELASRDHVRKLLPLVHKALEDAKLALNQLTGIAYTSGPGLIGALLVGATFGRSLAWSLNIPSLGVHHLEAHLFAAMLEEQSPSYPFITLLVSGGHTQLMRVNQLGNYQILGETLDDAVGEAFDKTAKLLGLPYPGGAKLAELANQGRPGRFHFPRPMIDRPDFDFSFSGLKTAVIQAWQKSAKDEQTKADLAYAFQEAAIETLVIKTVRAIQREKIHHLVIAGGVGANRLLRQRLRETLALHDVATYFPRIEFCTDNAAMVAYLGFLRLKAGQLDSDLGIHVRARWPVDELTRF